MTAVMDLPATRSRDGLLVVTDGVVAVANQALCRLLGTHPDELLGCPPPDWVPSPPESGEDLDVELTLPGGDRRVSVTLAAWPGGRVVVVRSAREAELARLAHRDALTGLLNRRAFTARLHEEAAFGPLGLIAVDLDHFKAVNDEHGHPVGDRVLAEAAERIAGQARAIDSVARIGGEEFAWLLPGAGHEETLAAAERLRHAIRSAPFATGLDLTTSIGVATAGAPDELIERADRALYWAKECGRDTALAWTPEADRRARRARSGEPGTARHAADLAVALAARENWSPRAQARLHQAALAHDLGRLARLSPVLDAGQVAWIAGEGDGAELLRIAAADPATLAADAAERRRGALAWWG